MVLLEGERDILVTEVKILRERLALIEVGPRASDQDTEHELERQLHALRLEKFELMERIAQLQGQSLRSWYDG